MIKHAPPRRQRKLFVRGGACFFAGLIHYLICPKAAFLSGRFQWTAYALLGAIDILLPQIIQTGEIQIQCLICFAVDCKTVGRYVCVKHYQYFSPSKGKQPMGKESSDDSLAGD